MHTNTSTERHIIQPQSCPHRNNSQLSFIPSTLMLPVCFFNLTVYVSESKPVSITPTGAISMRGKANNMSDESKAWILTSFCICPEPADSHFQSWGFLSARLVFRWTYNGCLCCKTCHYSIFAWVMSVSADLCLSISLFFKLHCRICNGRLCNA